MDTVGFMLLVHDMGALWLPSALLYTTTLNQYANLRIQRNSQEQLYGCPAALSGYQRDLSKGADTKQSCSVRVRPRKVLILTKPQAS